MGHDGWNVWFAFLGGQTPIWIRGNIIMKFVDFFQSTNTP